MLVVASASSLGTPTADGTQAILRLTSGRQEILTWNLAQGVWTSVPRYTMRMIDQMPMAPISSQYIQDKSPDNIPAQLNDNGIGFQLEPVPDAKEYWDAGLRLQERLEAEMTWDGLSTGPGAGPWLFLNWYEFDIGSSFLAPTPTNPGVYLTDPGAITDRDYFMSTGWKNSPVAAPTHPTWYPELYGWNIRRVARATAERRWVYGNTSGGASSDGSSKVPPTRAFLYGWFEAEDIPQANGSSVSLWRDQSGFAWDLKQPTGTKQPTLTRNAVNGKAVVTFDGVNDNMLAVTGGQPQPLSIYMVMRQRAGGTSPQVWLDGNNSSFLWYRNSDTDQVDFWMGGAGGDLIYHRGSNWPSPYVCFNGVFNGSASTTIWENKTLKASGTSTSPGDNGLSAGYFIGCRHDESLNAQIDVAEFLVYATAHDNTTRNSIIDYLNAKYNLF